MQDGGDLLHQQSGLFLELLDVEGAGVFDEGEGFRLLRGGAGQAFHPDSITAPPLSKSLSPKNSIEKSAYVCYTLS